MEHFIEQTNRTELIIQSLAKGISREQLAEKFGHKDYRSLDMQMRREGYTWDKQKQNYLLKETKLSKEDVKTAVVRTGKVSQIIRLFEKGYDAKGVAAKLFFPSHHALAEYMKQKKYHWDQEEKNYIPMTGIEMTEDSDLDKEVVMNEYVHQVPRYLVPGIAQNKNVQLSHLINQLIVDFSHENNLTQRQMFECAVLEFLIKYGYEHEVKALFQK